MIGHDQVERYRMMSQPERWREVEALMSFAWRSLKQLPAEERTRRLKEDERRHDEADEIVLAHLRSLR